MIGVYHLTVITKRQFIWLQTERNATLLLHIHKSMSLYLGNDTHCENDDR
jgi:hypothetical protein